MSPRLGRESAGYTRPKVRVGGKDPYGAHSSSLGGSFRCNVSFGVCVMDAPLEFKTRVEQPKEDLSSRRSRWPVLARR